MNVAHRSPGPRAGRAVDAVIVGAGHSGLAMSRCLAGLGVDHVVLERAEIANAWRRERWDSLRLLTPNWQTRLPGFAYTGPDPDGFMQAREVADLLGRYARFITAPVRPGTRVTSVREAGGAYRVATDRGIWSARAVVLASGAFAKPKIPVVDAALPASIRRLSSLDYRNPGRIADGRVLVVGASATGLQLAAELQASGREVTLAVGEHVRMPRLYRGRDIQWWLDRAGVLDEHYTTVDDIARARRVPSPQLIGTPDRRSLDLNRLQATGVRIVGRLAAVSGDKAQFSGSLRNCCTLADLKLERLLNRFDDWAVEMGLDLDLELAPAVRPEATRIEGKPPLVIDLARDGLRTVIWATGLRPDFGPLELPVFDAQGRLRHDGGIVRPGVYVMGLPFMRRRKSSYMHGAEDDARDLSAQLLMHLKAQAGRRVG